MNEALGSIVVLLFIIVLYITEVIPVAATALLSCALLAVFHIAEPSAVWAGFSSDTTLLVAGMIVVGTTLIDTGFAASIGNFLIRLSKGRIHLAAYGAIIATLLFSAFMNNSTAVATMLPVMAGIIAASGGVLHEKQLLMPLAVASNAGGMLTLIGTTAQMISQSALESNGLRPFGFFDFAWIGVPISILFIIYMLTAGRWIGRRLWPESVGHTKYIRDFNPDGGEQGGSAHQSKCKQVLSALIMVAAVLFMVIPGTPSNGTIAITAAITCVVTGCIPLQRLYRKLDLTTIFVLAGGIGFANGLDKSGGGRLLADWIAGLFGKTLTPFVLFVMFSIAAAILTLFMSNTAVTAMLTPIALAFTTTMAVSPYPVLMGICMASNCAFSTPIATPSMTLVLGPGEYRFSDYVKYCMPFNIIAVALILLIVPAVWPL